MTLSSSAIILMGQAGSGKSTIGKTLAGMLGWDYISTGDLAKSLISGPWQELGQMAPEAEMRKIFDLTVEARYARGADGFVIDGMPRKPEQVAYLDGWFDKSRQYYYLVGIDERIAQARLLDRGRSDDTAMAIQVRQAEFNARLYSVLEEVMFTGHKYRTVINDQSISSTVAAMLKDIRKLEGARGWQNKS